LVTTHDHDEVTRRTRAQQVALFRYQSGAVARHDAAVTAVDACTRRGVQGGADGLQVDAFDRDAGTVGLPPRPTAHSPTAPLRAMPPSMGLKASLWPRTGG
jgi:hypothetical protein